MIDLLPRTVAHFFDEQERRIVFSSGQGPHVLDSIGRKYVDFVLGYGPVVLGHAHLQFQERTAELLQSGLHFPGYSQLHDLYLEKIAEFEVARNIFAVFFKSSSEAVTAALRVGYLANGRQGFIRCGFLGWHNSLIAGTPAWHSPPEQRTGIRYSSFIPEKIQAGAPVLNWTDLSIESLSALISDYYGKIGCFVVDLYQLRYMPASVLRSAIGLCRDANIKVVLDETKTAGRTNPLGISGLFDLHWDMKVVGKAVANGGPLSILLMGTDLEEAATRSRVAGTYAKEMFGPACALATAEIMLASDGYRIVKENAIWISDLFNSALAESHVGGQLKFETVIEDTMIDLVWKGDWISDRPLRRSFVNRLSNSGILLLDGHPSFVSIAHTPNNLCDMSKRVAGIVSQWSAEID